MLISERNSRPVIETARVHDVVAFALIGVLGLGIGQVSFSGISASWRILIGTPRPEDAERQAITLLALVADIVSPIMASAGQLVVAAAVAERHVLGLPANLGRGLFLVWVANFEGQLAGALLKPSQSGACRVLGRCSWLFLRTVLVQIAVVVAFGRTSCGWRRYLVPLEG